MSWFHLFCRKVDLSAIWVRLSAAAAEEEQEEQEEQGEESGFLGVWWEFDCVILPPFIIMTDSHLVGI